MVPTNLPLLRPSQKCLPESEALGTQLSAAATAKHNISLNSPFHLEYSCGFFATDSMTCQDWF